MSVNSTKQNIEQLQDWIKVNNIKPKNKILVPKNIYEDDAKYHINLIKELEDGQN